jgi:predicted DsbA family dithiol-disulfide isomerase
VRVEIWSDVICPWCYIGKRRFDTALANVSARRDTSSVDVVFRPFQLDPTAAPGSVQSVPDAYARKFGGPERATQIINHITGVAAESGIDFHLDRAQRANTLLAHRALTYAEHHGHQAELKERLMQAYFTDGENVGDVDVVVRCAADVGLDAESVRAYLEGDEGRAEVMEHLAEAASNGITAVPTYVINDQWAVPGAQDIAVFERVIDRILDGEQPVTSGSAGACDGDACDV